MNVTYVQKVVLQPPTQGRVVMWVGGMVISCKTSFSSPINHIKLFILPLHSIIINYNRSYPIISPSHPLISSITDPQQKSPSLSMKPHDFLPKITMGRPDLLQAIDDHGAGHRGIGLQRCALGCQGGQPGTRDGQGPESLGETGLHSLRVMGIW